MSTVMTEMAEESGSENDINLYAKLATLPPEQMLDIKALAKCLSCSCRTIHRWVRCFQLPPPVKMGNKSIWTVKHIRDWIDRRCRKAESETNSDISRLSNYQFRS